MTTDNDNNSERKKTIGVKKIGQNVISEEVATDQLNTLLDYYDFDPETDAIEDQLPIMEKALTRLKKAIMRGNLAINLVNGKLTIKQKLVHPPGEIEELSYKLLSGRSKMVISKRKYNDNYGRIYALAGYLTGLGEDGIQALEGIDISIVECLGFIFLAV